MWTWGRTLYLITMNKITSAQRETRASPFWTSKDALPSTSGLRFAITYSPHVQTLIMTKSTRDFIEFIPHKVTCSNCTPDICSQFNWGCTEGNLLATWICQPVFEGNTFRSLNSMNHPVPNHFLYQVISHKLPTSLKSMKTLSLSLQLQPRKLSFSTGNSNLNTHQSRE